MSTKLYSAIHRHAYFRFLTNPCLSWSPTFSPNRVFFFFPFFIFFQRILRRSPSPVGIYNPSWVLWAIFSFFPRSDVQNILPPGSFRKALLIKRRRPQAPSNMKEQVLREKVHAGYRKIWPCQHHAARKISFQLLVSAFGRTIKLAAKGRVLFYVIRKPVGKLAITVTRVCLKDYQRDEKETDGGNDIYAAAAAADRICFKIRFPPSLIVFLMSIITFWLTTKVSPKCKWRKKTLFFRLHWITGDGFYLQTYIYSHVSLSQEWFYKSKSLHKVDKEKQCFSFYTGSL